MRATLGFDHIFSFTGQQYLAIGFAILIRCGLGSTYRKYSEIMYRVYAERPSF